MKKIFKTLTAAILAFVIAFGSFSAFAAEEKDVILWYDSEFTYAGALSEGKNTVEIPEEESFYFVFDAEKAGYYTVTHCWTEIENFMSPEEIENGIVKNQKESRYLGCDETTDTETYLFFFDEGENILTSWRYNALAGDPSNIEITYYGETVSDISFTAGTEYFLVPDWNIYEYYEEDDGKYSDGIYYYFDGGETVLTFDSGKTISITFCYLICSFEDKLEIGEKNVTVYFLNDTFEKTISVYPVSKEITNIEVVNIEKYLDVPVAYNSQLLYDFDGMEMILTYADGHTETVTVEGGDCMGIDLLNGNPYYFTLDYFYEREGDTVYFCVTLANEEFIRAEGTLREATGRENRQHLNYRIYEILSDAFWDIRFSFEYLLWADNLWEGIVYLRRALFDSADEIFTAFESIVEEVADCLRG